MAVKKAADAKVKKRAEFPIHEPELLFAGP
jgi:hypothetical protein